MLSAKQVGDTVRIWVAGCATGEEAYSLAMTLLEHPLMAERRLELQVFATDIDTGALQIARRGCYPRTIHHTVSAERLRRFFSINADGYQVQKELREVVMFAPQNLVNDPPFSHLDLISCRNLLIYMQPELQRQVLQIFISRCRPTASWPWANRRQLPIIPISFSPFPNRPVSSAASGRHCPMAFTCHCPQAGGGTTPGDRIAQAAGRGTTAG
jgi:hypothetical protein